MIIFCRPLVEALRGSVEAAAAFYYTDRVRVDEFNERGALVMHDDSVVYFESVPSHSVASSALLKL